MIQVLKRYSLFVLSGFYIFAGINHFLNPEFYLPLIPDYFSNAEFINVLAGLAEIILGIGLLIKKVRRVAIIGVVLMLLAFIPSHVYFIQKGSCIDGGLCVSNWIGWIRLVIIHPILIAWPLWYWKQS
ncbi:MAG TPA: hypothetical protein DEQ87_06875 [Algoriphagus sp.]|jgi:uncharacterized membrane protein|uniref:DoxX family protein n=2 Tax=Algoriphagus TaxID=246875 RepID=UPI000C3B2275|nr:MULTISPECIES: hypothetical protein [unclassified Algoriphagus]MAL16037.1 hypothetical protein [Algoriphagus sp.]MAN85951.1 hypothetical protein [Algoriphagus sp.]HAH36705.1 hypothetical protein [Algoriphagus sp.]HCB46341.1 hypothetical protein [Algoriphagus sp.]HCD87350.1 hypothetical protein [Algoriphagus sp.]|tara:strand:+ start:649 stop:1032 length:384 start_codon:yes stop_codon:yes gene_type:complete